jgi:hypothetical protein
MGTFQIFIKIKNDRNISLILDIVIKYCLKNKNIDKVLCDLK